MSGTWSNLLSYAKLHTLNFDGSHNNQDNKAGAGCIIRDDDGELVIAASYNLIYTYPRYCDVTVAIAEAVALRNGLKLAQTKNFKIGLIKGDSKEIYDHVVGNSRRCKSGVLWDIVVEIKSMFETFPKFELINREGNRVADKLASMGSSLLCNSKIYTKYDSIPTQIAELIEQEKLVNFKKESNLDYGEGSTSGVAKNIGVAGAVAGAAMFAAWGVSKLFSGEGSSDKNEHTNNKNELTNMFNKLFSGEGSSDKNEHTNMFKTPGSYDGFSYNDNFGTKRSFILHFHGSDSNQTGKATSGCIIRDKQGKLVVAAAYNISDQYPDCHIAIAEAVALRNGLKLAKDHNVKLDLILGDNDEVIDRVNGIQTKLPRVAAFTQIIQEIMRGLYEQSVATKDKVKRTCCENNQVAHKLASVGTRLYSGRSMTYTREQELPDGVAELIREDQRSLEIFN